MIGKAQCHAIFVRNSPASGQSGGVIIEMVL